MKARYRVRATVPLPLVLAMIVAGACADRLNAQPRASASDKPVVKVTERVKTLESRLQALSENYEKSSSLRDTEYITKIQRQYEAYYEKAFNTQQYTIWGIGLFLTVILALAGRLGFQAFDRQIEYTVKGVVAELRSSFEQRLQSETSSLKKENAQQVSEAIENLQKKYDQALQDLTATNRLHELLEKGLIFASLKQYDDSLRRFRNYLIEYLKVRTRNLVTKDEVVACIANLFRSIHSKGTDNFQNGASEELKNNIYKELSEELVLGAKRFPPLGPILRSQGWVQGTPEQP